MEVCIQGNHLRALLAVAPQQDVRYYLNGIHLDLEKKIATATDGHRLIQVPIDVVKNPHSTKTVIVGHPIIVPRKTTKTGIIEVGRNPEMPEEVTWTYVAKKSRNRMQSLSKLVDGIYPNIESVKPAEKDIGAKIDSVSLNPLFLADVALALGASWMTLQSSGEDKAYTVIFGDCEKVYYLVMPMRNVCHGK